MHLLIVIAITSAIGFCGGFMAGALFVDGKKQQEDCHENQQLIVDLIAKGLNVSKEDNHVA